VTQHWLLARVFFYLISHWIYQWRNHDLILNVYNLFKYLYANITSNSFGNGVINKWFPAPVVRFMKISFFSFIIEWKAFFWCAVLKLSNLKNTTDLLIIAHACEGHWRSIFQLSCRWLWLVNCREVKCMANLSRR
jgi:hypothetical protein